jgi:hypothetical protein
MNFKSKTTLLIVVAVIAGLFTVVGVYNTFVDHVSDKVIEKLSKEYSPSPYGPGLDPDKVDVTAITFTGQDESGEVWESP